MNEKITLPKLASLLAQRIGENKKTTEEYIRTLFSVISDTLESGESVKIKGLGTFKIVMVEERRSVNVSTGEQYIIPSHGKLSFIPAKELADAVNSPFSMFETVELSDSITEEELEDDKLAAVMGETAPLTEEESKEEGFAIDTVDDATDEEKEIEEKDDAVEDTDNIEQHIVDLDVALTQEEEECDTDDTLESSENENVMQSADSGEVEYVLEESTTHSESMTKAMEESDVSVTDNMSIPELGAIASEDKNKADTVATDEKETLAVPAKTNYSSVTKIEKDRRRSFGFGFLWGVICSLIIVVCGIGVCYYLLNDKLERTLENNKLISEQPVKDTEVSIEEESACTEEESEEEVAPTEPSDVKIKEPGYDTVTTTRYLTTIAKEHYGNYHFWPYIYEENKSILGHPNKIRPGTRVVVPELSKYGVDANSKADEAKAKAKGVEIYSRF
ncbi:MAG: HU family DNA-binding protein [Muribaculum sp.]|nr:HU family DNA-binding protein [Muribaculum sp.]